MPTYSLTTTPQTVSTGAALERFTNTGAQRAILAWGPGRSEILWPGAGVDPRSRLTMTAGATVTAWVPVGTGSLDVTAADIDESPGINVIDGGEP